MISTTNAATKAFFMEITQIFLWFKPIFTSLGMQHYMIISQQIREVCMKKEKGVEEKEFQKIIRMFKDDKKSFEEMISIRTSFTIYYILTVQPEEEITFWLKLLLFMHLPLPTFFFQGTLFFTDSFGSLNTWLLIILCTQCTKFGEEQITL